MVWDSQWHPNFSANTVSALFSARLLSLILEDEQPIYRVHVTSFHSRTSDFLHGQHYLHHLGLSSAGFICFITYIRLFWCVQKHIWVVQPFRSWLMPLSPHHGPREPPNTIILPPVPSNSSCTKMQYPSLTLFWERLAIYLVVPHAFPHSFIISRFPLPIVLFPWRHQFHWSFSSPQWGSQNTVVSSTFLWVWCCAEQHSITKSEEDKETFGNTSVWELTTPTWRGLPEIAHA